MLKRMSAFLFLLVAFVFCSAQFAHAGKAQPAIKPHLLQASLKTAGVESELLPSFEAEFAESLYIPNLKGSAVIIGFPAAGLLTGKAFTLEIDDMTALVTFTGDKKLEVSAGDSRIESVEAFAALSCILTSVFEMVENILKNVFSLNIIGIIAAVFNGVVNIISCA